MVTRLHRHAFLTGGRQKNGLLTVCVSLLAATGFVSLCLVLSKARTLDPVQDARSRHAYGEAGETFRNMSVRLSKAERAWTLLRQRQITTQHKLRHSVISVSTELDNAMRDVIALRAQIYGTEIPETSKRSHIRCLRPAVQGCVSITDKSECLNSVDGRINVTSLQGLRVFGEPCVWCSSTPCTESSQDKCVPKDWLINGEGITFKSFYARNDFFVASCYLGKQNSVEAKKKMFMNQRTGTFLRYRSDFRCGERFGQLPDGSPIECNPDTGSPCCSEEGFCGFSQKHCGCQHCVNYMRVYKVTLEKMQHECTTQWEVGYFDSPEQCAAASLFKPACRKKLIIFAPRQREWKCRCCVADVIEYRPHLLWNVYKVG
eukprot:TRINITY_DN74301_c0_g1_i1.p1 TRINITY_DN74301_c0_g1~~TRINITY_DN74301_c0_g1_i1.p1  ORF type:complete len:374 (-),score=31.06 TRINITY_DN74301_c0_g1_i1:41-1162(-)